MAGLLSGLFGAQQAPQAQAPGQSINGQSLLQKLLDPSFAMPIASALMQRGQGNAANFGDAFGAAGQAMAQKAQTNKTLQHLRKEAPDLAADVDAGLPIGEAWKVYTEQRYAQKGKKGLINAGDGQLYNQDTGEWLTAPGGGDDFADGVALADAEVVGAGIAGLEFLRSIPGTVGGFVRMNGGAYGREVQDILLEAMKRRTAK